MIQTVFREDIGCCGECLWHCGERLWGSWEFSRTSSPGQAVGVRLGGVEMPVPLATEQGAERTAARFTLGLCGNLEVPARGAQEGHAFGAF